MTHPLNNDPYAVKPVSAVRNPSRYLADQSTTSSTQPQQRIRARVHYSLATQSIPNAVLTTLILDTIDFDTAGLLKSNGFTIPTTGKVTGPWRLQAHVTWAVAAAGYREINIYQGANLIASDHHVASNDIQSQNLGILVNDPSAGVAFTLQVYQNSGGALNMLTEAYHTYFEIVHLW